MAESAREMSSERRKWVGRKALVRESGGASLEGGKGPLLREIKRATRHIERQMKHQAPRQAEP